MNQEKVHELAFRVVGDMGGAFTMALGYVGDRLGLFRAMAGAGPLTSEELAAKTALNERDVREWLRAMVAADGQHPVPSSREHASASASSTRRSLPEVGEFALTPSS